MYKFSRYEVMSTLESLSPLIEDPWYVFYFRLMVDGYYTRHKMDIVQLTRLLYQIVYSMMDNDPEFTEGFQDIIDYAHAAYDYYVKQPAALENLGVVQLTSRHFWR